jgi:hypothetical protein
MPAIFGACAAAADIGENFDFDRILASKFRVRVGVARHI